MVEINGVRYEGNNVTIIDGKVTIDGKAVDVDDKSKVINVIITGNVKNLEVGNCNKLKLFGECGNVNSINGNIDIQGNVTGDVTNKNGNINCSKIEGNATNKNGNIKHSFF